MIAIICAMQEEAQCIVEAFGLKRIRNPRFHLYGNRKVVLIVSKVGKVHAAISVMHVIAKFKPKRIINVGTAGRLSSKIKIGEVTLVTKVIQRDIHVPKDICPPYLLEILNCENPKGFKDLRRVTLLTGDQFIHDTQTIKTLSRQGDIVDMEGYSIALVSKLFSIPCVLMKVISDGSDEKAAQHFVENLDVVMRHTVAILKKFLNP